MLQGKCYTLDNLPIWVFKKVIETKERHHLIRLPSRIGLKVSDKRLEDCWRSIMSDFIKEYGVSDSYKRYKNEMCIALDMWYRAHAEGQKHLSAIAQLHQLQAMQALSLEGDSFEDTLASVSKGMGFRVDPMKVTVKEFYSYSKILMQDVG